jgi:hypothetical protein
LLQAFVREQQEKGTMDREGVFATNHLISLLVATGRVSEARELLETAKNSVGMLQDLQMPAYGWYMLVFNALAGDAGEVDGYAGELHTRTVAPIRSAVPRVIGQCLLNEALTAGITPYNFSHLGYFTDMLLGNPRLMIGQIAQEAMTATKRDINLCLVRGVVFLEAGDLPRARTQFDASLEANKVPGMGSRRVVYDRQAETLARMYLDWLDTK